MILVNLKIRVSRMAKEQKQDPERQEIPHVQRRAYSSNPLSPPTPEERAETLRVKGLIQVEHAKTQKFVREKFIDEPKPIWIDKGT